MNDSFLPPAFPAIDDNNDFDEFAHELAGTHKNYNNDVATMIHVLAQECRIFPPEPDTDLGLLTNTLGYMQAGFPYAYAFGADEDEDEDPDNRYEVEVQYMNNMENSSPPEELQNNEEYDEYEDENLNPDMFEDEEEDDEDYSSDEDE